MEERKKQKISPEEMIFGRSGRSLKAGAGGGRASQTVRNIKKVYPFDAGAGNEKASIAVRPSTITKSKESLGREKLINDHWKGSMELLAAQSTRASNRKTSE
jgi:hypothetical protein